MEIDREELLRRFEEHSLKRLQNLRSSLEKLDSDSGVDLIPTLLSMGTISLHASFKKIEAVCDTLQQEEASEIQRGLALGLLDAADLKPHTPFATSIEPRASSALSVSHSAEATDREAVAADSATGGDLLDGEPASSSPHLRATLAGSSPHRFAGLNPNPFPFHAALQPCELKFSSSP